MARLPSNVKKAFLRRVFNDRSIAREGPAPDGTTRSGLESISYNAIKPVLSGIQFQAVSGNGQSQTFSAMLSPSDAADLAEELITLYDRVVEQMPELTSEPAIFNEMMKRLEPVTSYQTDHSGVML